MRTLFRLLLLSAVGLSIVASAEDKVLINEGFESGLSGWRPFWSRSSGAGQATLTSADAYRGTNAVRIEHHSSEDWSFEPNLRLQVKCGEVFALSAALQLRGPGSATLCVSTWDSQGRNVRWDYGHQSISGSNNWRLLQSRFAVPEGVAQLQPRLIGNGESTVLVDEFKLNQLPSLEKLRDPNLPPSVNLSNAVIDVVLDTTNAAIAVHDHRTGKWWRQQPIQPDLMITKVSRRETRLELELFHVPTGTNLTAVVTLDRGRPEFTLDLAGDVGLSGPLRFPHPFLTRTGDRLVIPMNEGIAYPVEDTSIEPFRLIAYGGHGISMSFWGVTDDQQGHLAIIETPDDAAIQMQRMHNCLVVAPEWDPQKGRLGYARRLRYVFFDRGGHVAIAKRYREYIRQHGRLITLAEKRQSNPNVDLLIGAVNVWSWDRDAVSLVKELQEAGITRILWSGGGSADALRALNDMNVLTSRYDIYQDVMDPANFPFLNGVHGDWTTAAWPGDVIKKADDNWLRGWGVKGKQGEWYYCGVICDLRAPDYARKRIPAELASKPYRCRFIDTTTAAPWNECYHTNHLMTRTESREAKMRLLDLVSRELNLVTGCETGHDAAVPYLHYFEGMLSLGPYRIPDAGRDMQRIWSEVPERVAKFQLGQDYRLPLWELVYHDCVVAQWYWGDYNNKLPSLWDKRDLFNLLYGTPPMFMFNRSLWQSQKARFVQSYTNTCPYVKASGYKEMTDHRFLTPDRSVQQTCFGRDLTITVNFGTTAYPLPSGTTLGPMDYRVEGRIDP
jgi:hypothetical protein